jgi:hypothetical protein
MTLDIIVKIVAYGIPALLIVVGFFAYFAGYTVQFLTHDAGMINLGILLMASGIVFYAGEFAIKVYAYFNE